MWLIPEPSRSGKGTARRAPSFCVRFQFPILSQPRLFSTDSMRLHPRSSFAIRLPFLREVAGQRLLNPRHPAPGAPPRQGLRRHSGRWKASVSARAQLMGWPLRLASVWGPAPAWQPRMALPLACLQAQELAQDWRARMGSAERLPDQWEPLAGLRLPAAYQSGSLVRLDQAMAWALRVELAEASGRLWRVATAWRSAWERVRRFQQDHLPLAPCRFATLWARLPMWYQS